MSSDPAWANPIKELVKARALEQQARAVAAVIDATTRSRMTGVPLCVMTASSTHANTTSQTTGQLHVVNGLPSSIYSTANTIPSVLSLSPRVLNTSISPLVSGALTPNLIANIAHSGFFDRLPSGLRTPTSPLVNPFPTPPLDVEVPTTSILPRRKGTQPLQIKRRSIPPLTARVEQRELEAMAKEIADIPADPLPMTKPPTPTSPTSKQAMRARIVKPSLPTLEKAMSVALFFEQYYHSLLKLPTIIQSGGVHPGNYVLSRARRLATLEASFHAPENRFISEGEKNEWRDQLAKEENRMLRERRRRVDAKAFEMGRVIGHGAFGVVRIARERKTGRLVAMKQVRRILDYDMLTQSFSCGNRSES